MVRIIEHGETSPLITESGDAICRCGLSKSQPMCDGSHSKCIDEEIGKVYKYKDDGSREIVN